MSERKISDKTLEEYKVLVGRLKKLFPPNYNFLYLTIEDMNQLNIQDSTRATYIYAVLRIYGKEKLKHGEELAEYARNIRMEYDKRSATSGKELPTIEEIQKIYYDNMGRKLSIGSLIVMFYTYPFINQNSYAPIRNELHNLTIGKEIPKMNMYDPETRKIVIQDTKKTSSEQRIDIELPSEINNIFYFYIKENNLKNGDRLFPNLTSNLLSKYLRDYSIKIIGKPITSTTLRKSLHHRIHGDIHKRIAEYQSDLEPLCKKMGHSVKTATNYYSKHGRL
jgi:hypothetical protein